MSTLTRRLHREDEGFTLVEVLVALTVFAVVATAMLPLLITSMGATVNARLETEAKNQAQLRIERMRNLQFHVARQNGPYIDLLDLYYTQARDTSVTTYPDGSTGQFLASAPGTGGAPSGPAYRVTHATLPDAPGFSQVTYTQFLQTTHTLAPVPTGTSGYSSLVEGFDTPPSQLVGITVITTWQRGATTGNLRTYTEVADATGGGALATSQARATALKVTATSPDLATTLVGIAGDVKADGSVTDGSQASVQGEGASLEEVGVSETTGAVASAVAPPNPATTAGATTNVVSKQAGTSGSCGWGSFGKTAVENVSATTSAGAPVAPANAGTDMRAAGAQRTAAGILTNTSPCGGYGFAWTNTTSAPSYPAAYGISSTKPLVWIADAGGGGGLANGAVVGEAGVAGTSLLATPKSISAGASARTRTVNLLPTTEYPNGLVQVTLTSASMTCKSGAAPAAAFSLQLQYAGGAATTYSWNSTTSSALPVLPDPSQINVTVAGTPRPLSDYVSWKLTTGIAEGDNGVSTLGDVFGLSVEPAAVGTGFDLQLGSLSCVAEDLR